MNAKTARPKRRHRVQPPASGRPPSPRLLPEDVEASAEALIAFHGLFDNCFAQCEQRRWSLFYLCGQLSNLERKTIEPMVLALLGADPRTVRAAQRFITEGRWDRTRMRQHQHELIADELGEADGVVIADGCGFPKQGSHSVGVAYQYCGHLGKVANCQQGVLLVYVSARGYTFLDERLYVPECWFSDAYRERWAACRIPADLAFQTEPELALAILSDLQQQAMMPFRWVTADESYGKSPGFLDGIAGLDKWYLVEVPRDTRVWLRTPAIEPPGPSLMGPARTRPRVARSAPRPLEVRELAQSLPKAQWIRRIIKEGSKSPLVAEFAFLRATTIRDGLPGPRVWVVFRRSLGSPLELKAYFSNAPTTCPRREFIRVSGPRWPVETVLKEGQGEVGQDHYEIRTWPGWHHHMTHTFLAHLFLIHLRLQWQKSPALTTAQARQLIARAIEEEAFPLRNVLSILHYRQCRNHAAYRSHRKRTLKRHRWLSNSRQGKTS